MNEKRIPMDFAAALLRAVDRFGATIAEDDEISPDAQRDLIRRLEEISKDIVGAACQQTEEDSK